MKLVCVNDTGEGSRHLLTALGFGKEVFVPGKEHMAQTSGAFQQGVVGETLRMISLGRQYFDAAAAQAEGYRRRDMDVHVEGEAQRSLPAARNRLRPGESWAAAASAAARSREV